MRKYRIWERRYRGIFCGQKNQGAVYFQSYASIIAVKGIDGKITIDRGKWDYSVTTGKYRNMFLGESKAETEKKIKSGEYILADLN